MSAVLRGEPDQPVWTQECGRGQSERLVIREGISPGYGDDYVPRLEGQWIDITDLPAGRYVLEARAAPDAGTVLVRPAVIGIAPRGNGPPPDVVNRYLELAGRAPVLVAAPGKTP